MYKNYQKKLVNETDRFLWYVRSDGVVERITKSTKKKVIQTSWPDSKGTMKVKINKDVHLAALVIKSFTRTKPGSFIIRYKDGDKTNCALKNLIVISDKKLGHLTGYKAKSMKVSVKKKYSREEPVIYRSIRQAAKALHVSNQTLSMYLRGKFKSSVLDDYIIKKEN